MQAIFAFFYRFRATFLFLLLQSIAFLMIIRFNNYQKVFMYNLANSYVSQLNRWSNEASTYFHLREVNQELSKENAELRAMLMRERQRNYGGLSPLVHQEIIDKYTFEPAKVVNKTTQKLRNFLTIEKGSLQGIKKDMGVISSNGIVGRVIEVSSHYAIVATILNNQNTNPVNVKLQKTKENYLSHIQWGGREATYTKLKDIPLSIEISVGDTVRTSGYNAFFPADIMVGVVARINPQKKSTFHDIDVKLSTNFNTLSYVYVVKNKLQDEQTAIEKDTNKIKLTKPPKTK
ncbi:MAG: rod shape-determining protein MreC [Thermonemataceae bacterium]|nr:rod shape-determining protein MreC [Thermonemataceae bacterium]